MRANLDDRDRYLLELVAAGDIREHGNFYYYCGQRADAQTQFRFEGLQWDGLIDRAVEGLDESDIVVTDAGRKAMSR